MIRNIIWSENQNQFHQSPLYQPPLVHLASSHLTSDFLCVGAVFPETSACIMKAAVHPEAEWWGVPRPSATGWGPAEKHSSTGETILWCSVRPQNVRGVKDPFLLNALPLRGASTCWVPSFHVLPSWPHSCFLVSLPINSLSTSPCLGCTFPKNTDKSGAVLNLPLEWHPQPIHQSDNIRASLCGTGGR